MEESLQRIAESLSNPDWVSIVVGILTAISTVAAVIISLFSTIAARKAAESSKESNQLQKEQIELQNKQNLFEIKSKNYTTLKRCVSYFKNSEDEISSFIVGDHFFVSQLSDATLPLLLSLIGREIDKNRITNSRLLNAPAFSSYVKEAINDIEYTITEIPLLFSESSSAPAITFLGDYNKFISTLYNYGLLTEAERNGKSSNSPECTENAYALQEMAKQLSQDCEKLFDNNIFQKMEEEIKLQRKAKK